MDRVTWPTIPEIVRRVMQSNQYEEGGDSGWWMHPDGRATFQAVTLASLGLGPAAGDSELVLWGGGTARWTIGVDADDSYNLKVSKGGAVDADQVLEFQTFDGALEIHKPTQIRALLQINESPIVFAPEGTDDAYMYWASSYFQDRCVGVDQASNELRYVRGVDLTGDADMVIDGQGLVTFGTGTVLLEAPDDGEEERDAFLRWQLNPDTPGQAYHMGIDNSDGDAFKWGAGEEFQATPDVEMSSSGQVTFNKSLTVDHIDGQTASFEGAAGLGSNSSVGLAFSMGANAEAASPFAIAAEGDSLLKIDDGTYQFAVGLDASDGNKLKFNSGTTLADPSDMELDASGNLEIQGDLVAGGDLNGVNGELSGDVEVGGGLVVGSVTQTPVDKAVILPDQVAPSSPASGYGLLFSNGGHPYWKNSAGNSWNLSRVLGRTGGTVAFYGGTPTSQPSVLHGNTDGEIGGLTISAAYQQSEVQALRDKCEELADDVRSLRAALVSQNQIAEA